MKFAPSILVGLSALLSAKAVPIEVSNDVDGPNPCSSRVILDCELTASGEPCLSGATDDGGVVPWAWYDKSECEELQNAKITYKICNDNAGKNTQLNNKTYTKFLNTQITPSGFGADLSSGECREQVIFEDLPKCKVTPISVQMEGRLINKDNDGPAYCYAYAFNKSRSKAIPTTEIIEPQLFEEDCPDCGSSVAIGCKFSDKDGNERSCIGPNKEFMFLNMPTDKCAENPVEAQITMQHCNNGDSPITPFEATTYQKFKGQSVITEDFYETIPANTCVTNVVTKTIDTCKKNYPMSIQLKTSNTCRCFLFKEAKIENYDGDIPFNPEIDGNEGGKQDSPTPLVLWITELADPNNNANRRFIELYSPNKRNYVITEPLKLVKIVGGDQSPSGFEDLKGLTIDANGFLLICNRKDLVDACENEPVSYPALLDDQMGKRDYAIVEMPDLTTVTYIDIYGVPGTGAANSFQYFTGGRAFRKRRVIRPNDTFTLSEWIVAPSAGSDAWNGVPGTIQNKEASPGCWYGAGMDCGGNDQVGPPTVSPAPSAESDRNLYKSGKGKQPKAGKGDTKNRRRTRVLK